MAERTGSAVSGNGFDKKMTTMFVKDIERHFGELDTLKSEHLTRCKRVRENIASLYDRAKDAGIPKKALKAVVKIRGLQEEIEELCEADDAEDTETIEMLRHALGDLADTPLGEAAAKAKRARDFRAATLLLRINSAGEGCRAGGQYHCARSRDRYRLCHWQSW